ncbi:MAG: hypothetical protein ACYC0I_06380 [Acidimicrobiales bacterium]
MLRKLFHSTMVPTIITGSLLAGVTLFSFSTPASASSQVSSIVEQLANQVQAAQTQAAAELNRAEVTGLAKDSTAAKYAANVAANTLKFVNTYSSYIDASNQTTADQLYAELVSENAVLQNSESAWESAFQAADAVDSDFPSLGDAFVSVINDFSELVASILG